jgi:hypothetical protein
VDAADRRVVTASSLLALAALVTEGEVRHDEIVQLLTSSSEVDLIAELLARARRHAQAAPHEPSAEDAGEPRALAHWVATSARAHAPAFERMIEAVVGRRRVLGVAENRTASTFARANDLICFLVPGKGVVAGAEIAGAASTAQRLIRDSDRFSRLYQLKNVELFGAPGPRDVELEDRLAKEYDEARASGPLLIPVSEHTFAVLTARRSLTEVLPPTLRPRTGPWSNLFPEYRAHASNRSRTDQDFLAPLAELRVAEDDLVLRRAPRRSWQSAYPPPGSRR